MKSIFCRFPQKSVNNSTVLLNIVCKRNLEIPKGQTNIVKLEDRQDHGQQNEMKDKHRTHNTTLKTKAGVTRIKGITTQK